MTNEVLKQLYDRKSVRAFLDKEIGEDERKAILKAAAQAPTAGNQQLYTIINITDKELQNALIDTCDHQPMIGDAKWVLVFCADCKKWYDAYKYVGANPRKPGVGDFVLAICDTYCASQNAVVAAESLGIGSCYIGDILENNEEQRKLLKLPEYVVPVGMLIFGYPTKQQEERDKPLRVRMECLVHENEYHSMNEYELHEMWSFKSGVMSYEEWIRRFCDRKYNSDFSKEMQRSVAEYIKQFEPFASEKEE